MLLAEKILLSLFYAISQLADHGRHLSLATGPQLTGNSSSDMMNASLLQKIKLLEQSNAELEKKIKGDLSF